MSKENKLSQGMETALALLKSNEGGLTIADMKKLGFENANSSHLTSLVKRGLVQSEEIEIEVPTIVKRKVQKYFIPKSE